MSAAADQARQNLHAALTAYIQTYSGLGEGEFLGEWAFIAHIPHIEETGLAEYWTGYHAEHVPNHIARGLFGEAIHHLDHLDEEPTL